MENISLELVKSYQAGSFKDFADKFGQKLGLSQEKFSDIDAYFHTNYDDWYRSHYEHYGDKVQSLNALVSLFHVIFSETNSHMPLSYKNCAISSGTNPHIDAVMHGAHSSDKLARVIGLEKHIWQNIKDSSDRSLARAHKIHPLFPEMHIVPPSAFEGTTRVLSSSGRKLTGGMPFDAADYMSFWNTVIDMCKGFILDDVNLDRPPLERVLKEIELAQSYSNEARERVPIMTSDWANSRNSVLEMARGNYIRFGLHPLRPDMQMDMRLYDQASNSLYTARLVDCVKPVLQSILRWTPQGIAAEEACWTAARLFNLHRMRTDPVYNEQQNVPLDLDNLPSEIRDPSQAELREMDQLINSFEPFLLKYVPHLIRTQGLPEVYNEAKQNAAVKAIYRGNDIINGDDLVKWQRANIPSSEVEKLWDLTKSREFKPEEACPKRAPLQGAYLPQRRLHSFDPKDGPFAEAQKGEFWTDNPYDNLDEMSQDLARMTVAVLETGMQSPDSPDYHGVRFDMKRGVHATAEAEKHNVGDLSLLPGVLHKKFAEKVSEPTLKTAQDIIEAHKNKTLPGGEKVPQNVFGTPIVKKIDATIRAVRSDFAGPGRVSPSSDFRLSLEMEMLRRNYTHITFQEGWETSEDSARMMVQAMKIEFGKIERPAGNNRELTVLNEDGAEISLFERYDALKNYLEKLSSDPAIQKHVTARDASALNDLGIRHISNALAKIIETYDFLKDQKFNDGRFELQQVVNQESFARDIDKIQETKLETMDALLKDWVWLWDEKNFDGLRQDYRDAWEEVHGDKAQWIGPHPTDDTAIKSEYAL